MKIIKLKNNLSCVVDDNDFIYVSKFKWHLMKGKYAATKINKKTMYMHRFLMTPEAGLVVDHINGDCLDNRRINLRNVTPQQNNFHRVNINKNNTSGYRGVSWDKSVSKWMAYIYINGKRKTLGVYKLKTDAVNRVQTILKEVGLQ